MKLSKKDYSRYHKIAGGGDMHLISAEKHNGRRTILFGNYSYRRYCLFLDDKILYFDSYDSWQIGEIMDDYLKTGSYWYIGIW